jgi:hypothetical protein
VSGACDVVRAVDVFGQENDDAELFAHAAKEGRVFLTCDEGVQAIAHDWLRQGQVVDSETMPAVPGDFPEPGPIGS